MHTTTTNPNGRLLRFLSATPEQQAAIDRILEGRLAPQPPAPTGPLLMRVKDAAILLGVHRTTLWRLVKAGRLETVELLGSLRVRRADIEALACGHHAQGHQAGGQTGGVISNRSSVISGRRTEVAK